MLTLNSIKLRIDGSSGELEIDGEDLPNYLTAWTEYPDAKNKVSFKEASIGETTDEIEDLLLLPTSAPFNPWHLLHNLFITHKSTSLLTNNIDAISLISTHDERVKAINEHGGADRPLNCMLQNSCAGQSKIPKMISIIDNPIKVNRAHIPQEDINFFRIKTDAIYSYLNVFQCDYGDSLRQQITEWVKHKDKMLVREREDFNKFREFLLKSFSVTPEPQNKSSLLVVLRKRKPNNKGGGNRVIANQDYLVDELRNRIDRGKYNLSTVYMEDLSAADQIKTAARSDVMIGMHGAGLTWSNFMKKGSRLIEIFPEGSSNEDYIKWCEISEVEYCRLYARSRQWSPSLTAWRNLEIIADEELVLELIKDLE